MGLGPQNIWKNDKSLLDCKKPLGTNKFSPLVSLPKLHDQYLCREKDSSE